MSNVHLIRIAVGCLVATATAVVAGAPSVGAAPKGDATAVATRIIKYNFPSCKLVADATRRSDGSIRASCDGTSYLVFTVLNPNEGKVIEVAMNCAAAQKLAGTGC